MKGTIASSDSESSAKQLDQNTRPLLRTGMGGAWIALALGTVLLIVVLVFILENLRRVEVSFLVFSSTLPLGVALLFAAIGGALVVLAVGSARILQLRLAVRRSTVPVSHEPDATAEAPGEKAADR